MRRKILFSALIACTLISSPPARGQGAPGGAGPWVVEVAGIYHGSLQDGAAAVTTIFWLEPGGAPAGLYEFAQ
ncbi:MAG TPA: hypothetical protein VF017_09755 [Thermoanaerobaculia bacterium]|nr:hypothetical protein [Thermoanaerobaculia bacterium]